MIVKVKCLCGRDIEINPASMLNKKLQEKLTPKQRSDKARKAVKVRWSNYKRKIKPKI